MPNQQIQCVVVTPERAVLDEKAEFVAVPMYDGELGVLPGRAPLIGRLGFGELRTTVGATVQRLFVDGGFVQIHNDVVTVLTPRAIPTNELSVEKAGQALAAAQSPATTPADQEAKLKAQERARAQKRLAERVAAEADL